MSKDNVIVIPYDSKSYKFDSDGKLIFNPFDEYIVIDYYSPNGLNEKIMKLIKFKQLRIEALEFIMLMQGWLN